MSKPYAKYATYSYYNHFWIDLKDYSRVSLICRPPSGARNVHVYRWDKKEVTHLLRNGNLDTTYENALTLSTLNGLYNLAINENLSEYDSSFFCCKWYYNCGSRSRRNTSWGCRSSARIALYLNVYDSSPDDDNDNDSDGDSNEEQCILTGDETSIYFIGDTLQLICTEDVLIDLIKVNNENVRLIHTESTEDSELYNITVDVSFNGSSIKCFQYDSVEEGSSYGEDLCEDVPPLTVYEYLLASISPQTITARDQKIINLTCTSNVNEASTFEWDIMGDIMFGDMSMEEVPGGTQLSIFDIDFENSNISSFVVSCNVSFGSKQNGTQAIVHQPGADLDARKSLAPVLVVIPIAVVLVIFCLGVIVIVFYRKSKLLNTTKDVDSKDDNLTADVDVHSNNVYYTAGGHGRANLGLGKDSEEVYNVAYASYDS